MRDYAATQHAAGRTIGFVPTMGALHAGHMALVDEARSRCDTVVLSLFVNPTQFNVAADFEAYPRTPESDLDAARLAGVDAVYAPTARNMYPAGHDTTVHVERTAAPLEGAGRPGHFDGVATIVTKLFNAVRPDVAVFGMKDYQQLAVVRRMTTDLDFGTEIVGLATVRQPDGLALSSRNARLDADQRSAAPIIYSALCAVRDAHARGSRTSGQLADVFREIISREPLARVEYVSVSDQTTLEEMQGDVDQAVVSCAVWFGDVRLIDNILIP